MNNDFAVWIDDLLGAVKEDSSLNAIKLIESCGRSCAMRNNVLTLMVQLRDDILQCKNRTEIVEFLSRRLPMIAFIETTDGIIVHTVKDKCNCKMASEIFNNRETLCNCTLGWQKAMWSELFGKQVDVEIVGTILRGGSECVFKIMI